MESTTQSTQQTQTSAKPTQYPAQQWSAEQYAANGRFVANLAGEVLHMLAPKPCEEILDLGCGDGALTEQIAASGANVIGCDADTSMLQAAEKRGLRTVQADMRSLPFTSAFDAVFSNAAMHWVMEQQQVIDGVYRVLKPEGRFIAELGGLGNIAAIRVALNAVCKQFHINAEEEAASHYPSREEMQTMLERAGFRVERIELVPRPTLLKSGMEEWLRTFRRGLLNKLSTEQCDVAVRETVALLQPVLRDAEGIWWGDYVRLRFKAIRTE